MLSQYLYALSGYEELDTERQGRIVKYLLSSISIDTISTVECGLSHLSSEAQKKVMMKEYHLRYGGQLSCKAD